LTDASLVSSVTFQNNGTTRMTMTKQYDSLNRLTGVSSSSAVNFNYAYNNANQRVSVTNVDGTYWVYQYDALGQVTGAAKNWPGGGLVAGQQFGYSFDSIGNRQTAAFGGDQNGANFTSASYGANLLNQYTNRTVPGVPADKKKPACATNHQTGYFPKQHGRFRAFLPHVKFFIEAPSVFLS
jgi:YD repeat-containing protein